MKQWDKDLNAEQILDTKKNQIVEAPYDDNDSK